MIELPEELRVSPSLVDREAVARWVAARRDYRVEVLGWSPADAAARWSDEYGALRHAAGVARVRDDGAGFVPDGL